VEVDAQLIVSQEIDSLTLKDSEIASLHKEIDALKTQLTSRTKVTTEKEFKSRVPPPPPPLPKPRRAISALAAIASGEGSVFTNGHVSSPLTPPPSPLVAVKHFRSSLS
jgi:diaphanous 1